jgi:hypothetical protein
MSVSSTSYVRYMKLDSRTYFTGRQTAQMFGHRKIIQQYPIEIILQFLLYLTDFKELMF